MQRIRRPLRLLTIILLGTLASHAALAASLVDEIQKRGKIVVGLFPAAPPFGFTNEKGEVDGIDIEMARLMAKDLGVKLETITTNGASRIPTLLTGKADILIDVLAITPERAKQVSYSIPYGVMQVIMYGPESAHVRSWADLKGKKVGVTLGAVTDVEVTKNAPQGTEVARFDDDSATNTALLTGQVDVICATDAVVVGLADRVPDKKFETEFAIRTSPISMGMRRGDPDFLHWVNTFIYYHKVIGDVGAIYEKYMKHPLPETGSF
jgi:polar amino acid transport system substrate-binding protein